jgi:hypothetical protein
MPLSTPVPAAENYPHYEENNKANKVVESKPITHDSNISHIFSRLTASAGLVKPIYRII